MSRSQQGAVVQQAGDENKTYNQNAQTSFNTTQGDVTDFGKATNKFVAANPYIQGGEYQTSSNQILGDTAAGLAQSTGQGIQGAAVRTGQNAGGAIAATENMEEANMRGLSAEQAKANQDRIAGETKYDETGLGLKATGVGMQDELSTQQAGAAQGALGTQEQAAQTPSFMDQLGSGLIQAGVGFASNYAKPGCWIARELWGSWDDPRVVLVRRWLADEFSQRWYGPPMLRLYTRWGIEASRWIQTHSVSRRVASMLFTSILRTAERWQAEQSEYLNWAVTDGAR